MLLLDQAIERRRRAGDQRDAERRRRAAMPAGGSAGAARNMPITAREDDERHDARLGEAPELERPTPGCEEGFGTHHGNPQFYPTHPIWRGLQKALQVREHALQVRVGGPSHHHVAVGVDEIDVAFIYQGARFRELRRRRH